jgi:hypothetical protein
MLLFRLKHPSLDFKGTAGGVDFSNGAGTTSSLSYAHGLVKVLGCRAFLLDGCEEKEIEIHEKLNKGGTTVLDYQVLKRAEKKEGVAEAAPSVLSPPGKSKDRRRRPKK